MKPVNAASLTACR